MKIALCVGLMVVVWPARLCEATVSEFWRRCVAYVVNAVRPVPIDPFIYQTRDFPAHTISDSLRRFRSFYQASQVVQANRVGEVFRDQDVTVQDVFQGVRRAMYESVASNGQFEVEPFRAFAARREFGDICGVGELMLPTYDFEAVPRRWITPAETADLGFRLRIFIVPANKFYGLEGAEIPRSAERISRLATHFSEIEYEYLWGGRPAERLIFFRPGYVEDVTHYYLLHADPRSAQRLMDDVMNRLNHARTLGPFGDAKKEWARAWYAYVIAEFYASGGHEIGVPFFAGSYLALTGKKLKSIPSRDELLFFALFSQEGFVERLLQKVE